MSSRDALAEYRWIPWQINIDDGIGRLQIETGASRISHQQETTFRVSLKFIDDLLSLSLWH
jgi:hypothetical protein